MNYPPLPIGYAGRKTPLKICIVTPKIEGAHNHEDMAVAFAALAETLAAVGHNVTILHVYMDEAESRSAQKWVERYRNKGVTLVSLPVRKDLKIVSPHFMRRPYEACLWLKQQAFDVIHYPEFSGVGQYIAVVKHQGLAFSETMLCAHAHGSSMWRKHVNYIFPRKVGELCLDFMERQSVELADILISPCQSMIGWMVEQGWKLPAQIYVQQNILPATSYAPPTALAQAHPVHEIVFYGSLLPHKGFELFCDALDHMTLDELQKIKITFLGKSFDLPMGNTKDYVKWRARKWPFAWEIISEKFSADALDYLQHNASLAVIPSRDDNAPYAVLECLGAGVPFIASDTGGIPELIAPEDHGRVLFPFRADKLAEKIRAALQQSVLAARPAVDFDANKKAWVDWHAVLTSPLKAILPSPFTKETAPLVSVCICHFNRPYYLNQALQSVYKQDYPNIEVVLVDDASTDLEALSFLDSLEPTFQTRDWQIIRQQKNLYQGAALNCAVRHARGVYVKFLDDDNIAEPHEISTFVRVAQKTGADILTCIVPSYVGDGPPKRNDPTAQICLFVGASPSVGAFQYGFGDNNSLVKKDAFLALGGYAETYGVGHIDWEFHARAVLKGYRLEVIPEILFWYRRNPGSMSRTTPYYANSMLHLRTYFDHLPPAFHPLLLLAYGMSKGVVLFPSAMIDWKRPLSSLWLIKQRLIKAWQCLRGQL